MALNQRLLEFHYRLNQGEIDWGIVFDREHTEDARTAADMLVSRRFVRPLSIKGIPPSNSGFWVVMNTSGEVMNPCFEEKRWYFSSGKYARSYVAYLKRKKGCRRKNYTTRDFNKLSVDL